ncbi:hypothetical protein OC834_004747 [Tilletia horrida]|uniref:Uncharacterized protein n=1 Tax=Tilletia horrida TaxID=155126 RepID=A0AAN6GIR6_9BASI|nr:hypothetical protein OC834_004747 [Tilletia horrida]KAK0530870.1 hypothetical protein OC835_003869 [Tilletia horrida]KAK0541162.1 hypothetical protein OC842_000121 [Tilletia horrida]KAK0565781.1 hypothetical protein OC844_001043 [Tilletia horrida]
MRTSNFHTYTAAAALLLALASVHVAAQVAGDIATSTDVAGNLYTGTIAADGTVPSYTPVTNGGNDFTPIGAAGGGAGVPTTQATLQSISGYNPPPSTAIPAPSPNQGTIVSPSDIPGYTNAAGGGGSSANGNGGQAIGAAVPRAGFSVVSHLPVALTAAAAGLGAALVLL